MSLVIPPGYAQVGFKFSLDGDPEAMFTTCGVDIPGTVSNFQEFAADLADAWTAAFGAAGYPASYRFLGVRMSVGQDGGPPFIVEEPRSVQGTANIQVLPQNCALLVRKSTALGGRAGRGRFYLPPCFAAEGNVSPNGMLDSGLQANLQTAMNQVYVAATWVLLHDNVGPSIEPTLITGFQVQPQIATQRRRMRS